MQAAIPRADHLDLAKGNADEAWFGALTTGPFADAATGEPARPYSLGRLLWTPDALLLSLYAADENIAAPATATDAPLWLHDAFHVEISADATGADVFAIDLSPRGTVADARWPQGRQQDADVRWSCAAQVQTDVDGTIDDPRGNDDEEWQVTAAIPWRSLGLAPAAGLKLAVKLRRCDVPKDGQRRCGIAAVRAALAIQGNSRDGHL